MTPSTRKEMYLNKIATGEGAVPTPATREEMYLAKIAGEEVEVPTPATRVEMYLYKIGGGEIIVPTPATRLEMFLAAASGMPVSTPVPATREEILWDYIINGTNPQTITGVPPINFTGNGTPLISWLMKGNGSQSGTPTPDNPVMPTFCGVRTENLFDQTDFKLFQVTTTAYRYGTTIGVLPQGTYTFNATKKADAQSIYLTAQLNGTYSQTTISSVPFTFSADGESEYIIRTANNTGTTWEAEKYSDMMLNLGSTALPYEPYGWAEKITCAGQTTPVYLGQISTVRRIRKLVLTGEETGWTCEKYSSSLYRAILTLPAIGVPGNVVACYSTHYVYNYGFVNNTLYVGASGPDKLYINDAVHAYYSSSSNKLENWLPYLAAQYAAGNPVTVWYVLDTPTTGIVNEPLAKIGDYCDELHSEDAGVTIPTVKGSNTLTVETELQPSEVSITGYIAESQTMTAAKIMARASGMNVNDKELESLSKKELNSILKGTVKSDGRSTRSNG